MARPPGLVELAADLASVGMLITDADDRPVWANRTLHQLLGVPGPDASALPLTLLLAAPEGRDLRGRIDGEVRWLRVLRRRLAGTDGDGAGGGWVVHEITDVTTEREQELAFAEREKQVARVEAAARTGLWRWDLRTDEVTWSPELLEMFGFAPGTRLDYAGYRSLLHPDDVESVEAAITAALARGGTFRYTHRMVLADRHTERAFECYGEVVHDDSGRPVRMVGAGRDITEQRRAEAELAYRADHDDLTGLLNRRGVTARLHEFLAGRPAGGALLILDVDNFKDVNDLRGHVVGDQVMRSLAQLLRDRVAPTAVLGRLGGDEFALVLADGTEVDALAAGQALVAEVAATPMVTGRGAVRVTASVGVAPAGSIRDADALLSCADLALYEAKRNGRNRARLYSAAQHDVAERRVSILQRVHDALDGDGLALDAQPIVDVATRKVVGHEVLLRLRDGRSPDLGPAEFVPMVEGTDLMPTLDRWVVDRAVRALGSPGAAAAGLRLQANVSTRALEQPDFADFVLDRLAAADVQPARLGLEITETAAIVSLDAVRRLAGRLAAAGCPMVLDDFGAGFASFSYLKHLPFSCVKIDGEFVAEADRQPSDAVLVDAVVRAAHGLGMTTVAEHVGRAALVPVLAGLGVDLMQGFHLGRPVPLADVLPGRPATPERRLQAVPDVARSAGG